MQESDRSALYLVDLPSSSQLSNAVEPQVVDATLFETRPGLEIFQIDWHPSAFKLIHGD